MTGKAGSRFLLDSNILVALLNREQDALSRIQTIIVFVPATALGELYYGAYRSARTPDNLQRIRDFLGQYPVLSCTRDTAQQYGVIKARLKAKGRPLPENDIWIAATALQHDLTLITRDAHFQHIDGLPLETW